MLRRAIRTVNALTIAGSDSVCLVCFLPSCDLAVLLQGRFANRLYPNETESLPEWQIVEDGV